MRPRTMLCFGVESVSGRIRWSRCQEDAYCPVLPPHLMKFSESAFHPDDEY